MAMTRVRIEAGLHLEQVPETAQQKAGGDHQHQGEGQFTNHQNMARARALPGTAGATTFLPERRRQIDAAREPRGSKPEDGSGWRRRRRWQTPARPS